MHYCQNKVLTFCIQMEKIFALKHIASLSPQWAEIIITNREIQASRETRSLLLGLRAYQGTSCFTFKKTGVSSQHFVRNKPAFSTLQFLVTSEHDKHSSARNQDKKNTCNDLVSKQKRCHCRMWVVADTSPVFWFCLFPPSFSNRCYL